MRFVSDIREPEYYAVIFPSVRSEEDADGYGGMGERMVALAGQQPGFLGLESVRDGAGNGITVSYWRSMADIAAWKRHGEHQQAQLRGRAGWYEEYGLRIAKVVNTRYFARSEAAGAAP